ncbi:MAG: 4Fe-4S binding protein [Kiritimatiellaeota bacterium]|nr:4Fe-4S binding protein [Kiritimatiellota bacterium]
MIQALLERWRQGHRTGAFPAVEPALPDRFRGRPELDATLCCAPCTDCVEVCPVGALGRSVEQGLRLDLGRCLFCGACERACPVGALRFTRDYRLAARRRDELVLGSAWAGQRQLLDERYRRLFGRSLKLRQVSAGGCNACEADTNVLNTPLFDLSRFGIQLVAAPRHADGLLVTGPVTQNMRAAVLKTYAAVAEPKLVIAVGACASAGGPYIDHPETANGVTDLLPVDLFIPGCPPHPYTILHGLLGLLGRLENA